MKHHVVLACTPLASTANMYMYTRECSTYVQLRVYVLYIYLCAIELHVHKAAFFTAVLEPEA